MECTECLGKSTFDETRSTCACEYVEFLHEVGSPIKREEAVCTICNSVIDYCNICESEIVNLIDPEFKQSELFIGLKES